MHSLHVILVPVRTVENYNNLPDDRRNDEDENDINISIETADIKTLPFAGHAYECRSTETAGQWSDKYNPNVILGRKNKELFVKELTNCYELQHRKIESAVNALMNDDEKTIRDISEDITVQNENKRYSNETACTLLTLSRLLCGDYCYESEFYDTENYTAIITKSRIAEVEQNADKYALVFFDCHQ